MAGRSRVLKSSTHNYEDRHEKGCRSRVGDEVGKEVADKTGNYHHDDHVHGAERNRIDKSSGKSCLVETYSKGKSSGNEPEYAPVNLFDIFLGEYSCTGIYCKRNKSHHIGVDTCSLLCHPKDNGKEESNPCHISSPVLL